MRSGGDGGQTEGRGGHDSTGRWPAALDLRRGGKLEAPAVGGDRSRPVTRPFGTADGRPSPGEE